MNSAERRDLVIQGGDPAGGQAAARVIALGAGSPAFVPQVAFAMLMFPGLRPTCAGPPSLIGRPGHAQPAGG